MIREPIPQEQPEPQAEASEGSEDPKYKRKGKRKIKKVPVEPSRDSTPAPLRRAMRKAT